MKTIELNGLLWDTENLKINGRQHFTYEEAHREATKLCKRLPTKHEFDTLLQLPHTFDTVKRGMWFAERKEDLKSERSLFLPAAGLRYFGGTSMDDVGTYGYYWSATPDGTTYAYYLYFYSSYVSTYYNYRNYGFMVRCVSDIKNNYER